MKKIIFLLSPILLLLSSCETDFDVTGEWEEITVVYGILDKQDDTHYIRINKAYLGEEDAFIMGTENDSINFSNLTVRLIRATETGTLIDSIELIETTVNLEQGIFGDSLNPLQKLWKTDAQLDSSNIYHLKVINNFSGKVVTSQTPVLRKISISAPSISSNVKVTFVNNSDAYQSFVIKFGPTDNAKVYETSLAFYYRDIDTIAQDTTLYSLRWKQGNYVADGNETNSIQVNVEGENFYSLLSTTQIIHRFDENNNTWVAVYSADNTPVIKPLPGNYKRLIGKGKINNIGNINTEDHVDVFINAGAEELYNYIEINKPAASGVLLDKPVYTNIENGLGILSTRAHNSVLNKELNEKSVNELINGDYTSHLIFRQEND